MKNFIDQEFKAGDDVVFIRNQRGTPSSLMRGTVVKVNDKSINVDSEGKTYRVMFSTSPYKNNATLLKAVVIKERESRTGEPADFTGYPIRIGDTVAFTEGVYQGSVESFIVGVVTSIAAQSVGIHSDNPKYETARRTFDRVVVINGYIN